MCYDRVFINTLPETTRRDMLIDDYGCGVLLSCMGSKKGYASKSDFYDKLSVQFSSTVFSENTFWMRLDKSHDKIWSDQNGF